MPIVQQKTEYALTPQQCIAKIRKGSPKNEKGQMGQNLTHFRFDGKGNTELEAQFYRLYGEEPRLFRARCFYPNLHDTYYNFYRLVQNARTSILCTGERIVLERERGLVQRADRPCEMNGQSECPLGCRMYGELYLAIDGIESTAPIALVVTSKNENGWLAPLLSQLYDPQGPVLGLGHCVPLIIERKEVPITKRFSKEKGGQEFGKLSNEWMVSVRIDPSWVNPFAQIQTQLQIADAVKRATALLTSGGKSARETLALDAPAEDESEISEIEAAQPETLISAERATAIEIVATYERIVSSSAPKAEYDALSDQINDFAQVCNLPIAIGDNHTAKKETYKARLAEIVALLKRQYTLEH